MLNYIRAELYRNFNRAYLWVFTGILVTLSLAVVILCKANNIPNISLIFLLDTSLLMLSVPVFLVAAMLDMVTAEEQKNQTMRNTITFGLSRHKIVLSKVITSVILALISAFIISIAFFGSGAVLFGLGQDFSLKISNDLLRLLAALPLWIGAISVGTFFAIVISNSTVFGFVYAGIFLMTSKVIQLLSIIVSDKFNYIQNILITTQLSKLAKPTATAHDITCSVLIGVMYTVIFTLLSILCFKNKEIK